MRASKITIVVFWSSGTTIACAIVTGTAGAIELSGAAARRCSADLAQVPLQITKVSAPTIAFARMRLPMSFAWKLSLGMDGPVVLLAIVAVL